MAAVVGLPLQPDDEVLADLPEQEKVADPLRYAKIVKTCSVPGGGFREFAGEVVEIEVGTLSGDRLYRIRYSDGDLQHFTAGELRACIPPEPQERAPAAVAGLQQAAAPPPSPAAVSPLAVDAGAEEAVGLEEVAVAESTEDVALDLGDAEQEEDVLVAVVEQEEEAGEVFLTEEQEAVPAEAEQEVANLDEDVTADEVAALEQLAAGAEEDLNLVVLEDGEEGGEAVAVALEEEYYQEDKQEDLLADVEAAESDLIAGYLGGDDIDDEVPEEPPAPPARGRVLGVQRDIAKVATGRAKMKPLAKFGGRPAAPPELEMEVFDDEEEAT